MDRLNSGMEPPLYTSVTTQRLALGQLLLCLGCCCGRTERGRPELPLEQFKDVWRREHLNRTIQLTVSGCLGPCDVPNVALILTPEGDEWYGHLEGDAVYQALIDWARACDVAGYIVPRPSCLAQHRFHRFVGGITEVLADAR